LGRQSGKLVLSAVAGQSMISDISRTIREIKSAMAAAAQIMQTLAIQYGRGHQYNSISI
jgi:hypothetical protein